MNIAALFIRRPVMTTLIMLGLLFFGIASYRLLPVSDLPNVDFPTLQVSANLPGGSPETMASSVATPLEREFSTIAGVDSMTSSSFLGATQITLQFALSRNIDAAAQDVQAAIARAQSQLPRDMPSPPSYKKVNPADQPILYLALTSPTLPLYTVDEAAETTMAQRISTILGVAQVQVFGSQKYAVRAQVDPQLLASMGIGIDEVADAIDANNVNLPTGVINGAKQAYTVQATGQLTDAAAYRPLIIAYRNGHALRLDQLGRVFDSVENDKTAAWFIDQRAVILAVQKQPGTNTIDVVDSIKRLLPQFQAQLPASLAIKTLYDRSASIRASVNDVKFSLLLTLCLVVMVIFLFLRTIWATVIPSMAIPMSIIGTCAAMYLLGFSVDNLSLMALTLSIGFVVDDAVVMLENIVRHIEQGESVREAAFIGSREVAFTIVSMTLSLVAVFIPVLFMGGILGRLLNEFAITIAVAILISGIVSLTLTPMLCSRLLRPLAEQHHGRLYQISEKAFTSTQAAYGRMLRVVLRFGWVTIALSTVILAGTAWLFTSIPKGFLPTYDAGMIFMQTEAAQGISFDDMVRHQQALADIVRADPNVDSFMSSVGARGSQAAAGNTGVIFMRLKPRDQRALSVDQVIQELRPKIAQVPGIAGYMQNPPPIRIGGQLTKAQYQYTLQGPDTQELYVATPKLAAAMSNLPDLQDVTSDLQLTNPQVNIVIDRDKAATLGVSAQQIELALSTAYGTRQVSTIYAPNNQYRVILEVEPQYQSDPQSLALLHVRSASGKLVRMDALASIGRNVGPLSVNHLGQLPAVTVSFNLKPGASLGNAVAAVDQLAREQLPATITTSFQGAAQAFQSSLSGLGLLLLMAVLVIYLVLGVLYESFIHPLTILTALPFAGFGALLTLLIFGCELNVYAFVGILMLIGIVKKNGIMMIDFALEAMKGSGERSADPSSPDSELRALSAEEAIFQACQVRFRPIMMTTLAALMGTLPIAIGFGAGAESRRPLGLAVVGGLVFSQTLTLFVTPVFFLYMEKVRGWFGSARRHRETFPAPAPGPGEYAAARSDSRAIHALGNGEAAASAKAARTRSDAARAPAPSASDDD